VKVPTVPVNPVLRRELVERMRGGRTAVVVSAYLVLLSAALYLVYSVSRDARTNPWESAASQVAGAGRGIFEWLVFFMLLLVLFLVPGVTSGAIAGERERQTLVPLQITLLRPTSILLGKIAASTAFLLLLLVATLPLLAVSYLIGGVTIGQVVTAVAMVGAIGLLLAAVTAGISACVRRVQAATVLAYGVTLILVAGTFLAYEVAGMVDETRGTDAANPPSWILVANPIAAVADAVGEAQVPGSGDPTSSPFDLFVDRINGTELGRNGDFGMMEEVGPDGVVTVFALDENGDPIPFESGGSGFLWQSLGVLAALAALGVAVGARRLRTPAAAER
jgi:ABC-2 type transport system permease protein